MSIRKIFRLSEPPFLMDDKDGWKGEIQRHLSKFDMTWKVGFYGLWRCPCCKRISTNIAWRRRNSAYIDDRSNWLLSCRECHDIDTENFEADWEEYNRGRF